MILAIEIDNSKINFGIFENDGFLTTTFEITADIKKTSDEYIILIDNVLNYYKTEKATIRHIVLCSVVPTLTPTIHKALHQIFGNIEIIDVQKGIKTGFSIKLDNPSELGADLVANAVAAIATRNDKPSKKQPCVIVDVGTVTTIFALNEKNEFIGGTIFPGIKMSFESLHINTAQLPNVSLASPTKIIGKNSQDSIRSGIILGTAIMIDGFIEKFKNEMKTEDMEVIITGEYAQGIIPLSSSEYVHIPNLTLYGLYHIYKNNTMID